MTFEQPGPDVGVIPALTSTFLSVSQQESLRLIIVKHKINTGKGNLTSSHGCIIIIIIILIVIIIIIIIIIIVLI